MAKRGQDAFPTGNGNDIKAAFERAEGEKLARELKNANNQKEINLENDRQRQEWEGGSPEVLPPHEITSISSVPKQQSREEQTTEVPQELKDIYGDAVPPTRVLETFAKLKSPEKKKSYLDKVSSDKKERDEKKARIKETQERRRKKTPEVTDPEVVNSVTQVNSEVVQDFDPHSVASAQTIKEQKQAIEIRKNLATNGLISSESVQKPDVDISRARAPQFKTREEMQSEMDALNSIEPEPPEPQVIRKNVRGAEVASETQLMAELGLGSPRADRSQLRTAVDELLKRTKEKVNWWKSSEQHLIRRNQELDAQLDNIGGLEKRFRWLGEQYNKAGWKTKLAVGVALGLGSGVALSTVSVPAMIGCLSGLALQRTAALSTMYLKFEKDSHDKKWGKELAMAKAMLYTAAMTGGTMYAVNKIGEAEWPHHVRNWFVDKWPFGTAEVPVQTETSAPSAAPPTAESAAQTSPEPVVPPVAEPSPTLASEVPATTTPAAEATVATGSELPQIEVVATAGKGYEWMAKRMWEGLEELKQQGFDGSQIKPGSDMEKLFNADASNIDKVVHEIASDPERGFYKPDGSSVRIDLGSKMTIDSDGNIKLNDVVKAPENSPITPPVSADDVGVRPPPPEIRELFSDTSNPLEVGEIPVREPLATVDVTTEPPLQSPEASVASQEIVNQAGLHIPTNEARIYAGEKGVATVFGGTFEAQESAIKAYLSDPSNANGIVHSASANGNQTIEWQRSPDGKVMSVGPVEERNWLGFRVWKKAPDIDQLQKLLK